MLHLEQGGPEVHTSGRLGPKPTSSAHLLCCGAARHTCHSFTAQQFQISNDCTAEILLKKSDFENWRKFAK